MTLVEGGVIHRPLIKVGGALLPDDVINMLLDCRLDMALNRPGQAVLRFIDEEFTLLDSASMTIGKAITVGFATVSNDVEPCFDGEITSVGVESGPRDEAVFTVTAHDRAHRLGRNSAVTVYSQQKYSDIVSAVASVAGMTSDVAATSITFPYILQTTNAAAMLNEISARTGMAWWVDGRKIVMKKPASTGQAVAVVERGKNMRKIRATSSASSVSEEVVIRSWDSTNKQAIVGTSSAKPTALADSTFVSGTRTSTTTAFKSKRTGLTRSSLSQNEAQEVAKAMHSRSMSDEVDVRVETEGDAKIAIGTTVELKGVGTKLSGKYFVSAVEHTYSTFGYRTRFTSAGTSPATLVDLLASSGPVPWHRMGPVVGLVSDHGQNEHAGKVKVKLPLLGDNIATDWARVMSIGAGGLRGSQVTPSINDEVLVMFEDGDLRRPVVIGSVWNGRDKPPNPVVENGKVIEWVTKSQKGHTLIFRDGEADNKKNVEIMLADGVTKLMLGTDKVDVVANGKPLQVKSGDATITITDKGDIELKATNIKLTAQQDVTIAGANIKINANSKAEVKGNAGVDVKGAMVKVEASGITEVKGSIVKIN